MISFVLEINLRKPGFERGDLFIFWLHTGIISIAVSPGSISARVKKMGDEARAFLKGRRRK